MCDKPLRRLIQAMEIHSETELLGRGLSGSLACAVSHSCRFLGKSLLLLCK